MSRYGKTTISKSIDVDVDIELDDVEEFLGECDAEEIEDVIRFISVNHTNLTPDTLTYINRLLEANDELIVVNIEQVLNYIDENVDKAEYQLILNRIRTNVEDNDIEFNNLLPNMNTPKEPTPITAEMLSEYVKNNDNVESLQLLGMMVMTKLYEFHDKKRN